MLLINSVKLGAAMVYVYDIYHIFVIHNQYTL